MNVQTVDYKDPEAGAKFTQSFKETGFAVVSNHPISHELITSTFTEWENFFDQDNKNQYHFDSKTQAGYFPFQSENAKDSDKKDLKEFYHYYNWGPLPETCEGTKTYYQQVTDLASQLLSWVQENSPEDVRSRFSEPLSKMIVDSKQILLRPIHYPPLTGNEEAGAVRAAAHEDINLITLLPAATAPGLQVKDTQGNWHDVKCDLGTFVINCGDMLSEASGGYFPSTTHQVINPVGEDSKQPRYSMPLFLHPREEVTLSDRYPAGSYLNERLRELGLL